MSFNSGSKLCDVAKTEMRDLGNDAVRTPMVSVIVPNYNHAKYLPERLESVFSQSYADYEVILLDDGSTDGSAALLEACRSNPHVSHVELNLQNSGGHPFAQWEKGIRLAKGKYVWIAESDDRAEPTFLEKAVAALEPQDRFLITAFYEQGRSLVELTQITGMSLSNVKVRLFRCRNRLARILKDNKDLEK